MRIGLIDVDGHAYASKKKCLSCAHWVLTKTLASQDKPEWHCRFGFTPSSECQENAAYNCECMERNPMQRPCCQAEHIDYANSSSDTYVVYDQFHFGRKDHIEVPVKGWDEALSVYRFYKSSFPNECLGLCTKERYEKITNSYKF